MYSRVATSNRIEDISVINEEQIEESLRNNVVIENEVDDYVEDGDNKENNATEPESSSRPSGFQHNQRRQSRTTNFLIYTNEPLNSSLQSFEPRASPPPEYSFIDHIANRRHSINTISPALRDNYSNETSVRTPESLSDSSGSENTQETTSTSSGNSVGSRSTNSDYSDRGSNQIDSNGSRRVLRRHSNQIHPGIIGETNSFPLLDLPMVHNHMNFESNAQPQKIIEGSRHLTENDNFMNSVSSGRRHSNLSLPSRPSTAAGSRTSARSCRPTSSIAYNRPHTTGIQRGPSPRNSIKIKSKWSSPLEVIHLPPGGPDCLPGCGYSGLPCYACSTKEKTPWNNSPAEVHRRSFLGIPLRRSRRRSPSSGSHRRRRRSDTCFGSVQKCIKRIKRRMKLPSSRTNQCILTVILIYILLCVQFIITGIMAGKTEALKSS